MRCNDFDVHIDEMLSGILHPDASQHMSQCERCTSHYRARATVQNSLRKLAAVAPSGPSRATDRAVMAAYRRLQERRAEIPEPISAEPTARILTFPGASFTPIWASRTWLTGAAAAAVVFAVLGSAVHLWNGVPSVNAPVVATAPVKSVSSQRASAESSRRVAVVNAPEQHSNRLLPSQASSIQSNASQAEVAVAAVHPSPVQSTPTAVRSGSQRPGVAFADRPSYDSPETQLSSNVTPVVHLTNAGTASNVAQTASSTWPGYSNLMYCDPVVCSGPMQVVHIKVPVGQVKPNLGQTVGNAFVNAEVVIGPDGVARAIRVAN